MLQLQGFPRCFAEKVRAMAISPRSLAGMVGNATSVDLLEVLLDRSAQCIAHGISAMI